MAARIIMVARSLKKRQKSQGTGKRKIGFKKKNEEEGENLDDLKDAEHYFMDGSNHPSRHLAVKWAKTLRDIHLSSYKTWSAFNAAAKKLPQVRKLKVFEYIILNYKHNDN